MVTKIQLKKIGVDVLGYFLIIAAGLTGWLPGPGGIPLLILGLSLLATNHEWAERWLKTIKKHGMNISDKILSDNPKMQWFIDIAAIALLTVGVLLLRHLTKDTAKTAAVALIFASLVLAITNRKRFISLKQKIFNKR